MTLTGVFVLLTFVLILISVYYYIGAEYSSLILILILPFVLLLFFLLMYNWIKRCYLKSHGHHHGIGKRISKRSPIEASLESFISHSDGNDGITNGINGTRRTSNAVSVMTNSSFYLSQSHFNSNSSPVHYQQFNSLPPGAFQFITSATIENDHHVNHDHLTGPLGSQRNTQIEDTNNNQHVNDWISNLINGTTNGVNGTPELINGIANAVNGSPNGINGTFNGGSNGIFNAFSNGFFTGANGPESSMELIQLNYNRFSQNNFENSNADTNGINSVNGVIDDIDDDVILSFDDDFLVHQNFMPPTYEEAQILPAINVQ